MNCDSAHSSIPITPVSQEGAVEKYPEDASLAMVDAHGSAVFDGAVASDQRVIPDHRVIDAVEDSRALDASLRACSPVPIPACDAEFTVTVPKRAWKNGGPLALIQGRPQHRGYDQFLTEADPQWLIAKFAYGPLDSDLKGEEVEVFLLRGCGPAWEKLGTAITTKDNEHPKVAGVVDSGGRIFFSIPREKRLLPGRHRVRFVVAGDLSATDSFVEVLSDGAPLFVSDIDGTLTTEESAEFSSLLAGELPKANPSAALALTEMAKQGYRPLYLTARPDWLTERTRDFLTLSGFPPGILRTTQSATGASGSSAITYKFEALKALAMQGFHFAYAIGNTATDAEAYARAGVEPWQHRIFFRYDPGPFLGRRIDSYVDLLPILATGPLVCGPSGKDPIHSDDAMGDL